MPLQFTKEQKYPRRHAVGKNK